MTRRHLDFPCDGDRLAGTLDEAAGASGLLIVSGGNEIRSGAFAGQAALAGRIAGAGFPVFRFDRRGVGDSEGENRGFRYSGEDIRAAIAAFRQECSAVKRLVAFGNCDAASALILMPGDGIDALIAANPWTFDDVRSEDTPGALPPSAIRSRYLAKLQNPAELMRFVRGGVDLRKLAQGLRGAIIPAGEVSELARLLAQGLQNQNQTCTFLLAGNDRTAQAFAAAVDTRSLDVRHCPGAGHAFVEPHARDWLDQQILDRLRA
ncbi:hydrolase 1, exosortase A system-associated [Erythrobacter arachoides]|uniref:Hydrolase 1, exosortase A system-associated n=1 Tax=Aurantiacibacter arachoides TaxID=1850444 RepID=A0A844ZZ86_9SPHN|nr:hydrolase 1, exosortase A system-associated [Aurantiacibacter arachoides]MXO93028.1 hydrolase 1, exosortase A system-associated [Aurantiacibacter arachoides]GGD52556.1 hydrolase 1, exosortase A system-associated [Aurantiacibacter arachoides]